MENMCGNNNTFAVMVDADIINCKKFLDNPIDEEFGRNLYIEITAKYCNHIAGLEKGLYEYNTNLNFFEPDIDLESLIHNLKVLYNRLIAFKNYGYKNRTRIMSFDGQELNIINNNELRATQDISINISFDDVKKQISDMTGLSEKEEKDTLKKIDEIKAIVELKETKKTKWQKLKPILGWLADKSVDVGIAILPLLLKI